MRTKASPRQAARQTPGGPPAQSLYKTRSQARAPAQSVIRPQPQAQATTTPQAPTRAPKPARRPAPQRGLALLLLAALLALSLSGCAFNRTRHDKYYNDPAALAGEDHHNIREYVGTQREGSVYGFTVAFISGFMTVSQYTAEGGEEITIHCAIEEINEGAAKLVLVEPDGTVTTLAEAMGGASSAAMSYSFTAQPGEHSIKLVGRDKASLTGALEIDAKGPRGGS